MEKHVLYRDRQELQAADLNATQDYADAAHAHLVSDAITPERQYVGLTVSAYSATELAVAPGRLYDGASGQVYALEEQQLHSVFAMLPVQDAKWLAVSVLGKTEEINLEPRDFLVDLQTREVEPQTVPMLARQVCLVHLAQGLESPTPERPEPPTGYTLIAHARLSPSGVQEVVLATSRQLPNLQRVDARLRQAEGWILSAEPRLATMMSDMAGLASELQTRATREHVIELGIDMAGVKERLQLPDDYVFYGADHYLDGSETDPAHAGYAAFVEEGVRFPVVASTSGPLALLNPLDPAVTRHADGFLLPKYTEVRRLNIAERVGELTINQYQYTTLEATQLTMTRIRIRYGATRTVCTNGAWWRSGRYDPLTGIFARAGETFEVENAYEDAYGVKTLEAHGLTLWVRVTQFWEDREEVPYWGAKTVEHTISGSQLAQTFLAAAGGWMTSAEIYLTGVAGDGALNVLLTETALGQPDTSRVLARATLNADALAGGWNVIPWPRPVHIDAGRRYAVVLMTGGAHRVGYARGSAYTQGLLLYSQDGAYFSDADDRDLMMRLNFAQFTTSRAVVQLEPLQLPGGIHDLDLLFEGFVPQGCELAFEYQVSGNWIPVNGRVAAQLGAALLPLRAVFLGTLDTMPGLLATDSVAAVRRFGAAFEHWSTGRTLATPSQDIRVRVLLEYFDPAVHTLVVQLDTAAGVINPASTTVREHAPGARWIEARFVPVAAELIGAYQIGLVGGTSNAAHAFHVAERYDLAL